MQSFDPTALPGTVTQHLSIFELFLQSDSIVKLTMLLLLLASFWSWAVIFDKLRVFGLIEMIVFIFILVVGYYYAWQKGALEWV